MLDCGMKPLGRGRIVLWEGASLWAFDVPRAATARHSTQAHAHHALQLTFSVDGAFSFQIGPEAVDGPAVLIAPDVPHVYFAQGRNIILFVEPESRLGAALLRDLAGRPYNQPDPARFADLAAGMASIWELPRPDDATLSAMGQAVAGRIADLGSGAPVTDRRILRVLERMADDPDLQMSAGLAAGIACLSDEPVQSSLRGTGRAALSHLSAVGGDCRSRSSGWRPAPPSPAPRTRRALPIPRISAARS